MHRSSRPGLRCTGERTRRSWTDPPFLGRRHCRTWSCHPHKRAHRLLACIPGRSGRRARTSRSSPDRCSDRHTPSRTAPCPLRRTANRCPSSIRDPPRTRSRTRRNSRCRSKSRRSRRRTPTRPRYSSRPLLPRRHRELPYPPKRQSPSSRRSASRRRLRPAWEPPLPTRPAHPTTRRSRNLRLRQRSPSCRIRRRRPRRKGEPQAPTRDSQVGWGIYVEETASRSSFALLGGERYSRRRLTGTRKSFSRANARSLFTKNSLFHETRRASHVGNPLQ